MRDEWLLKGRLSNPNYKKGKVVALALDGTRHNSDIGENLGFGINLPGNAIYAIYFITPKNTPNKNNQNTFAVLSFEDGQLGESETLRLPETNFDPTLDLGIIDIKGSHAYPGRSPSTLLDFDYDGLKDALDHDDQNDSLDDKKQKEMLESVTICIQVVGQSPKDGNVHLSELLPYLDQGAILGPCPK